MPKHVPMRTCIVTKQKLPKNDLLRIVRLSGGQVEVDVKGKLRGRGANLAPSLEVFDQAIKSKAIQRALKLESQLTTEQVAQLRENFAQAIAEKNFRRGQKNVTIKVSKSDYEAKLGGQL